VLAELDGARQEVDELRGVLRGRIWIGPLLPTGDIEVPGLRRTPGTGPGRTGSSTGPSPTTRTAVSDGSGERSC
jgi:hypothetical protein